MKKFEYLTLTIPSGETADVNQYGADGWELVSTLVFGNSVFFIFKRPL